jgi:hypothetical protein
LIASLIRAIPKEEPRGSAEPALRRLQPHDRRVLVLVVNTLEALQNCEYPACLTLSTELMMAAISQLRRTTLAQVHMHGVLLAPSHMTSFICSLIVLFSKNPEAVKALLAGHYRTISKATVAEYGKGAKKSSLPMRSELRNAKTLAEDCLKRLLGRWTSLVSLGQVCSRDL